MRGEGAEPPYDKLISSARAFDLAVARTSPRRGDPPTRGKCRRCGERVAYAQAAAHVSGHLDGGDEDACLVLAASRERHGFWMLARARRDAYISDIDRMLRRAWLDCHRDHVSVMVANDIDYNGGLVIGEHDPDDVYLRMEDYTVEEVLSGGAVGEYTYDLIPSRTVFLDIKVVSKCSASGMKRPAEVAMKNERAVHDCEACGKSGGGRLICTECCSLARDRYLCASCARRHMHDGDLCFLPVRNSPRMGKCMYGRSNRRGLTPWPPTHAWGLRLDLYNGGRF